MAPGCPSGAVSRILITFEARVFRQFHADYAFSDHPCNTRQAPLLPQERPYPALSSGSGLTFYENKQAGFPDFWNTWGISRRLSRVLPSSNKDTLSVTA